MLKKLQSEGKILHDDIVPMSHLSCNLIWLETFIATLNYQENTVFRLQQLHFDVGFTLAKITERRLQGAVRHHH